MNELAGIVIILEHITDPSQSVQFRGGDPFRTEDLVGRPHGINEFILRRFRLHVRSSEDLQKAELQLIGVQ